MESLDKKTRHRIGINGSIPFDMIGKVFGKWSVISINSSKRSRKTTFYNCRCECGKIQAVDGSRLRNGKSHHCLSCSLRSTILKGKMPHIGKTKLTDINISEIRSLLSDGRSGISLARMYGVSEGHISKIKHNKERIDKT